MTQDIVAVWQQVFGSSSSSSSGGGGSSERVPTLLVGHSMGGALAVWAAASKQITGLDGVVVIDVVEGTAIGEARSPS
jgi:protein phosphatase methylesterase 1